MITPRCSDTYHRWDAQKALAKGGVEGGAAEGSVKAMTDEEARRLARERRT